MVDKDSVALPESFYFITYLCNVTGDFMPEDWGRNVLAAYLLEVCPAYATGSHVDEEVAWANLGYG
jgi:hypothetical protein